MADSRLTAAQTLAVLDNLAKQYQLEQAVADGGFTGEGTNTLLYALRYLVETRMRAWTSDSGIRDVVPRAVNALKTFDVLDSKGTLALLLPRVENILRGITEHHANYDTTYASFWEAFAAWVKAGTLSGTDVKVLGEVAEMMVAAGIAVDSDYCVAPEYRILGKIAYTGAAEATLTVYNTLDPLLYTGHTVEVYCIARNAVPDEIVVTVNDCKVSDDGPADTGSTDFPLTILNSLAATQVMDVAVVDGDTIYSLRDASLTCTSGGKLGDEFYLRVKRYRAAAV